MSPENKEGEGGQIIPFRQPLKLIETKDQDPATVEDANPLVVEAKIQKKNLLEIQSRLIAEIKVLDSERASLKAELLVLRDGAAKGPHNMEKLDQTALELDRRVGRLKDLQVDLGEVNRKIKDLDEQIKKFLDDEK